jgi:hypothetical protein
MTDAELERLRAQKNQAASLIGQEIINFLCNSGVMYDDGINACGWVIGQLANQCGDPVLRQQVPALLREVIARLEGRPPENPFAPPPGTMEPPQTIQ